jgi:hypothetical protein
MPTPVLDHLVYATPDLDAAVESLAARLGVRPAGGGQHPGLGTRNALLALGPRCYLEIVGPDPAQPRPEGPRWFGIDTLDAPRLVTWCAAATDLPALRARAVACGVPLGEVRAGGRVRPDGVRLAWRVTSPFTVLARGLIPFFIDWGDSPHPAASAPTGVALRALVAEHPDPEALARQYTVLDLDLPVHRGARAALVAELDTPNGPVTLR